MTRATSFDIDRSALLIVDMQNDYLHPDGGFARAAREHPERGWDMDFLRSPLPNIARLATAFRAAGRPVIFIVMAHDPAYADAQWPHRRLGLTGDGRDFLVAGSWGAEIVAELAPQPGDILVRKRAYNGFSSSTLDTVLRHYDVRACAVTGVTTAVCVSSTIRGGVDHSYDMLLVRDAVAETSRAWHEAESGILSLAFAAAAPSTDDLLAVLENA